MTIVVASSPNDAPNLPFHVGLLRHPLVPDLPAEFVPGVIRGLESGVSGSGELRVDRAGHDPVESSATAFQLAAELLAVLLAAASGPATDTSVRSALSTIREANLAGKQATDARRME